MTDAQIQDLLRRLREMQNHFVGQAPVAYAATNVTCPLLQQAADVLEALQKERDEANNRCSANLAYEYTRGLLAGERIGLEKAAKIVAEYGDMMAENIEKQRANLQPGTVYEHKLDAAEAIESEIRALITQEQSDDNKI